MKTFVFRTSAVLGLLITLSASVHAQNLSTVRGTIRDPSGLVVAGAEVSLKMAASSWAQTVQSDMTGVFVVNSVPIGQYVLEVAFPGFKTIAQPLQIILNSAPNLEFTLEVNSATASVEVVAPPLEITSPEASSPPVLVTGDEILRLPGADRMSSLQFITETTPGAFVLHDHLHVRGGHQIDWIMNGVPIPNTNMSSNIGRALDPKDIENVQINRGGYGAQSGDRTFAQVNILTRSGFDFNNDGDLTLTYGSFNQTNDQLGFGGHGRKFAYYASMTGNRTDLGLEPPTQQIVHNVGSGQGLFTTMSYTRGPSDEFHWTATARNDRFQIPVDLMDPANAPTRDIDRELDSFGALSWVHTVNANAILTVSPFYHYNNSQYKGGPNDPLITASRNGSKYFGSQVELKYVRGSHNLVSGVYGFYQRNSLLFGLSNGANSASVSTAPDGGVSAAYINDQYKPLRWITFNGGVRLTHFAGITNENAVSPRIGATVETPKLKWVLRSFYGTYYQAPPLYSVGGGVFDFESTVEAVAGFTFVPLKGERDIQREFGLTIPVHGWALDLDHFATSSRNVLDHDVLGNSNILLPLTTPYARLFGSEATIRSPEVFRRLRFHLAFANMTSQFRGAPSGGLIKPLPEACVTSYCYLDHDQRNTLTTGFDVQLPRRTFFSSNVVHGSGVLKANGPDHLPTNTTADAELGKTIGEGGRWTLTLTALNLANSRYPFDVNSSFAGTHFNNPREIIGSLRYRFHF